MTTSDRRSRPRRSPSTGSRSACRSHVSASCPRARARVTRLGARACCSNLLAASHAHLPRPSMAFHGLPRPSTTFHDLPRPSTAFHCRYPGMLLDEIKDAANEYYHHLIFGNVAEGERGGRSTPHLPLISTDRLGARPISTQSPPDLHPISQASASRRRSSFSRSASATRSPSGWTRATIRSRSACRSNAPRSAPSMPFHGLPPAFHWPSKGLPPAFRGLPRPPTGLPWPSVASRDRP